MCLHETYFTLYRMFWLFCVFTFVVHPHWPPSPNPYPESRHPWVLAPVACPETRSPQTVDTATTPNAD
jgi:hypothetical protein